MELLVENSGKLLYPAVKEGVVWELSRKGTPGKLTFSAVWDSALDIREGNAVQLSIDGKPLFFGYIFTRERSKEPMVKITAYDQLRYLKNKDTVVYEDKTAAQLLQMLAEDFRLNLGTVEDTWYSIESGVEENQTLFDILQNALDETLTATGKLYILYDDAGKLCLRNIESLKSRLFIDENGAGDFSYSVSIDRQTYDKIKLTYDNEKTGKRDVYIAQSGENINRWGVLQYYESLKNPTGAQAKADALLGLYNRETRTLDLKDVLGSPSIRAGSAVRVYLELGDSAFPVPAAGKVGGNRQVCPAGGENLDGDRGQGSPGGAFDSGRYRPAGNHRFGLEAALPGSAGSGADCR